jgi:hypothetical protein
MTQLPPDTFPLPPNYSGGDPLPSHIAPDPNRELTGWIVDTDKQTITLLYSDSPDIISSTDPGEPSPDHLVS